MVCDERSEDDDGRRPECVSDDRGGLAGDERSEDDDGRRPECVSDGMVWYGIVWCGVTGVGD